jgi:ubiquinol-cytochrome c reductase iron-sulfur subunit
MRRLARLLFGLIVYLLGRARERPAEGVRRPRIVPAGAPDRRAETAAIVLLLLAALAAVGFVVVYAIDAIGNQTQLLGIAIGLCLGLLAAAFIVVAKRLVVTEEIEEEYPAASEQQQEEVAQIVEESASRFTRKRLVAGAAGTAGAAVGLAALTPLLSLGPVLDTDPLYQTPWRRNRRLVDVDGRPYRATQVEPETFYTAYPQGADQDEFGAPVVVVRLNPATLRLPAARRGWAPLGIIAYSKICTHAGCALALYRKPTFAPVEPRPALICPCHYSTFDPAAAGKVIFGPAGRALPQLPLLIDGAGGLRAAGDFSGAVGPSWWGVRRRRPD